MFTRVPIPEKVINVTDSVNQGKLARHAKRLTLLHTFVNLPIASKTPDIALLNLIAHALSLIQDFSHHRLCFVISHNPLVFTVALLILLAAPTRARAIAFGLLKNTLTVAKKQDESVYSLQEAAHLVLSGHDQAQVLGQDRISLLQRLWVLVVGLGRDW